MQERGERASDRVRVSQQARRKSSCRDQPEQWPMEGRLIGGGGGGWRRLERGGRAHKRRGVRYGRAAQREGGEKKKMREGTGQQAYVKPGMLVLNILE